MMTNETPEANKQREPVRVLHEICGNGERNGAKNGAERYVTGDGHNKNENCQSHQNGFGKQDTKHSQRRCNTFAAFETQPDREHVAEDGEQRRQ